MKEPAVIQVDIDSFEDILADCTYDENRSGGYRTIYQTAVPRFLDLFDATGVRATFFVVGRDADVPENGEVLREIVARGHELANHTWSHPTSPTFSSLPIGRQEEEVVRAEEAILRATGVRTLGFKAPAYSIRDGGLFDRLEERGYLYDSSICPILLAPAVAFGQFLWTGHRRSAGHWGNPRNVLAPLEPYHPAKGPIWRRGARRILEVPVSTLPFLRIPFHASVALATSPNLFRLGFGMTRLARGFLNYQFHAFEMSDPGEVDPRLLRLRPGSTRPLREKRSILDDMLKRIAGAFRVLTTECLARERLECEPPRGR